LGDVFDEEIDFSLGWFGIRRESETDFGRDGSGPFIIERVGIPP
jgi:hypothetical protein